MRREAFARAGRRCEYCHSPEELSASPFVAEHIEPLALGGRTVLANLACACHGCNLLKSDHCTGWDAVARTQVRLFDPRHDRWDDHFHWSADGEEMIPLSPVGRATIVRLALNRAGLKNLRRVMKLADPSFPEL